MQKRFIIVALVILTPCSVMILRNPSLLEELRSKYGSPNYFDYLDTEITFLTAKEKPDDLDELAPPADEERLPAKEATNRIERVRFALEDLNEDIAEFEPLPSDTAFSPDETYIITRRLSTGPAIAPDTDRILFSNRSSYRLSWEFEEIEGFEQYPEEEVFLDKEDLHPSFVRTELIYFDENDMPQNGLDASIRIFTNQSLYCSLTVVNDFETGVRVLAYYITAEQRARLLRGETLR